MFAQLLSRSLCATTVRLRGLFPSKIGSKRRAGRRPGCGPAAWVAAAEPLEDRCLLSALTVNSLDDVNVRDDVLTLREALLVVNGDLAIAALTEQERAQIDLSEPLGTNDTVQFDPSLAGGTIALANGRLDVTADVAIAGLGADLLTIDAQGASQIFHVDGLSNGSIAVSLSGLTLTGGNADGGTFSTSRGGGIINLAATLELHEVVLSGNSSDVRGGGIYNIGGTLTVTNSTISENFAEVGGGGLYNFDGATMTIVNSTVSGNVSAGSGGGVFNDNASVTIRNSTLSGNLARTTGGGAYNIDSVSSMTVVNSTFSGNRAHAFGGGIQNVNSAVLTIVSSTFVRNRADVNGDGVGAGGGLRVETGQATLTNTLIAGNVRGAAGNLEPDDVRNGVAAVFNATFTLVADPATAGGLVHGTDGNIVGNGAGNRLPLPQILNPELSHNGGLTQTHALVVDSAAVNAGDPGFDPQAFDPPLAFDQRGPGFPRIRDGRVDIGAVELDVQIPDQLVVSTLDDVIDGDFSPGNLSLREAILLANLHENLDTITFAPALAGGTIVLVNGRLEITAGVTITGLGAAQITVDAQGNSQIFYVDGAIPVSIARMTLTGGAAGEAEFNRRNGGAIYNDGASLQLTAVVLADNSAVLDGGAVYTRFGSLTVAASTISGNSARGGGGIFNFGSTDVTINRSTISGNSAQFGGGLAVDADGEARVRNSTISGNSAVTQGGGIFLGAVGNAAVDLLSATFTANSGAEGGGVFVSAGSVRSRSTIIAGNTASSQGPDVRGQFVSDGFNLIGNTGGATVVGGFQESDIRNVAPRLGPLRDNGGPTFTHALQADSPALNAGNTPLTVDQRGFDRPIGGAADIGAYEAQLRSDVFVAAADAGDAPRIRVFDVETRQELFNFLAFEAGFTGGVRVALADVTGDGTVEIIAAPGPGRSGVVRIFSSIDGALIRQFAPFGVGYEGGLFVAAADFTGDGQADIAVGRHIGLGQVRVFRGDSGAPLQGFSPFGPDYRGGVTLGVGDVNGDGRPDLITGTLRHHTTVRLVNGNWLGQDTGARFLGAFNAFGNQTVGVYVAAGDLNGNGSAEVIVGRAQGVGQIRVFDGTSRQRLLMFNAFANGGVRVGAGDVTGNGRAEILAGAGPGLAPLLRIFDGPNGALLAGFLVAEQEFDGGVFIAGPVFGPPLTATIDPIIVTGAGTTPRIRVFDADTQEERFNFLAFEPAFTGGVRIALADVTGNGVIEIIAAPGPGRPGVVRIFSSIDGSLVQQFAPFGSGYEGGLFVAAADFTGNGEADIAVSRQIGLGQVRVFRGAFGPLLQGFSPFGPDYRGGVTLAVGDVDGNGTPDLITGTLRHHTTVRLVNGDWLADGTSPRFLRAYHAFPGLTVGVFVAAGDVNKDGTDDVIVGRAAGVGQVRVFAGDTRQRLAAFNAFPDGGVRVGAGDVTGGGRVEILAAAGPGRVPLVRIVDGETRETVAQFRAEAQDFRGGLFVAGTAPAGAALLGEGRLSHSAEAAALTDAQVDLIVSAAIDRFEAAGLDAASLTRLRDVQFVVADLDARVLGLSRPGQVLLDRYAAGFGWFVDPTPHENEEFVQGASGQWYAADDRAGGRIDLLTTVMHELGHELGLGHSHHGVMHGTLAPGVRRELEAAFAGDELFEQLLFPG